MVFTMEVIQVTCRAHEIRYIYIRCNC